MTRTGTLRKLADLERRVRTRAAPGDEEAMWRLLTVEERLEAEKLLTATLETPTQAAVDLAELELLRLKIVAIERRDRAAALTPEEP